MEGSMDEDLVYARHDEEAAAMDRPDTLAVNPPTDHINRSHSSGLQPRSILASALSVKKDPATRGRRASFAAPDIKLPAMLTRKKEDDDDESHEKGAGEKYALKQGSVVRSVEESGEQLPVVAAAPPSAEERAALAAGDTTEAQQKAEKYRSKQSVGSTASQMGGRGAREISETFTGKLYEMKWCFLSILINGGLLILFDNLRHTIEIKLPRDVLTHYGAVVVEIILLLSNIISIKAMDDGFQAYYGNKIATRGGSMALCGFSQTSSLFKLSYSSDLSLNSSVRKNLVRLSYGWILVELLKLTTPFPATALNSGVMSIDSGTSDCIVYNQEGVPVDRLWPTLSVEAGIGELVFGSALGVLRSESSEPLDATTIYISPQLVGAVNDGDTISGQGFMTNIVTNCLCTAGASSADFVDVGVPVDYSAQISAMSSNLSQSLNQMAMINGITHDEAANQINITTVILNSSSCGGYGVEMYPVCQTVISEHYYALIECQYMTDGTPASIAPERAELREQLDPADLDWMHKAFVNLFEGNITYFNLPPTVPGMLNPLLYWTSTDLLAINPSYFEVGLETMFGILMRAAVQRTYGHTGDTCIRRITVPDVSLLSIELYGAQFAYTALIIQLILSVLGAIAFYPWLRNEAPAGPAIRVVKESAYFTTMLADSSFSDNIRGLCNAPTYAIWQGLDVTVRVGESVESVEDEVGHITMDKKKLVRPLVNGRKYQ